MTRTKLKKDVASQIRTVEIILRKWDPIGISPGEFAPADEYDSYAPTIVGLIRRGCQADELAHHLRGIRTRTIGLEPDDSVDLATAKEIVNLISPGLN